MIHYILGHSGAGKTFFAFNKFKKIRSAVYFGALVEGDFGAEELGACVVKDLADLGEVGGGRFFVNILPADNIHMLALEKLKKVLESDVEAIFLDEFQAYRSDDMVKAISASDRDFYIIHQWPGQIEKEIFEELWNKAEKKYVLDPIEDVKLFP